MSKTIQVRGVPERLHRILKERAAREGMGFSDYIVRELESSVGRPTMPEWLESVRRATPIPSKLSATRIIRELRGGR